MYRRIHYTVLLCLSVMLLPPTLSQADAATSGGEIKSLSSSGLRAAQYNECRRQVGPFVTQSTAYQRRAQFQAQGYGVSGVFPGWGSGSRAYYFNVFWAC